MSLKYESIHKSMSLKYEPSPQVLPLRFVKFQRVNSISLFFPSNHGSEDQTIIHKIQLFGAGGLVFKAHRLRI